MLYKHYFCISFARKSTLQKKKAFGQNTAFIQWFNIKNLLQNQFNEFTYCWPEKNQGDRIAKKTYSNRIFNQ